MTLDETDLEILRKAQILRFTKIMAIVVTVLAAIPFLIGLATTPSGAIYLGIQTNLDDHMVYAAWMRQAMDGHFLLDNRFAVDVQPGLTIHLYFFLLGILAKLTGIPIAMTVARLALTYVFIRMLGSLLLALKVEVFAAKNILMIGCFGGGIGFLAWERFGQEFVNGPEFLRPLFGNGSPIDVWQPEAFIFPSMLTNGLFMVSLCLVLTVFRTVIQARDSWKPVVQGAIASFLLMNIHSYDMVLIGLVLIGYLATQVVQKQVTVGWTARALAICAGAIPSAVWIGYVLSRDPVFQARAATLTFSPGPRQVILGLLPPITLAFLAFWKSDSKQRLLGVVLSFFLMAGLLVLSQNYSGSGYLLTLPAWIGLFVLSLAAVVLLSSKDDAWNFALSWAIVGLAAIYFPTLFQRKLAMGILLPWSMLAAWGLGYILKPLDRSTRNLVASLTLLVCAASSILWFSRELEFVRNNVGRTAVHPVWFSRDTSKIIDYLNADASRKVVIAMPGIWSPIGPANFKSPLVPDLNAVLSGMAGAYTYAGHWSETPDYNKRRGQVTTVYLAQTSDEKRRQLLDLIQPDYIVAPNLKAFPDITLGDKHFQLADLTKFGTVVYEGDQLVLIRVTKT